MDEHDLRLKNVQIFTQALSRTRSKCLKANWVKIKRISPVFRIIMKSNNGDEDSCSLRNHKGVSRYLPILGASSSSHGKWSQSLSFIHNLIKICHFSDVIRINILPIFFTIENFINLFLEFSLNFRINR